MTVFVFVSIIISQIQKRNTDLIWEVIFIEIDLFDCC